MSPRTVGEYERTGPRTYKLGLFNAVFDGELLRGTVFDEAASAGTNGTASNGTGGPARTRSFAEVVVDDDLLARADAHDEALASDMAADQTAVTGGVEPLGLLLDEVLARLRAVERAVVALEKKCADR